MPFLTTNMINNTAVLGVRSSLTLSVLISNNDSESATVQIEGFYQSGTTKIMYVQELLIVEPGNLVQRNYDVPFDAFEFQFAVSSQAVSITAWGRDAAGNLTAAQRLLAQEINLFDN